MYHHISDRIIHIRKPVEADSDAIHSLVNECPPLYAYSADGYKKIIKRYPSLCVVAEFQGEIVGFLFACITYNEPDTLFVKQIAVCRELRRKGLAESMLETILCRPDCTNTSRMSVILNPDNTRSLNLFKKITRSKDGDFKLSEFENKARLDDAEPETLLFLSIKLSQENHQHHAQYASRY